MKVEVKNLVLLGETMIRKGFSKRGLAEEIKMAESTVIQICNGTRYPSPKTAKKICDALQVEFDEIFEIIRPAVKEVSQC